MKYLIISLILGVLIASKFYVPETQKFNISVLAQTLNARDRAELAHKVYLARVERIHSYLASKGSPLADSAKDFVDCGDKYSVDPSLIVAISGKESSFGKFLSNNYNAFGWTTGLSTGPRFRAFSSFNDAICTVASGLARNYDLSNIRAIAFRYAPPSENNTEGWIHDVQFFREEAKNEN